MEVQLLPPTIYMVMYTSLHHSSTLCPLVGPPSSFHYTRYRSCSRLDFYLIMELWPEFLHFANLGNFVDF